MEQKGPLIQDGKGEDGRGGEGRGGEGRWRGRMGKGRGAPLLAFSPPAGRDSIK